MHLDVLTMQDLDSLKNEFLQEFERLRETLLGCNSGQPKRWLRGDEVMEMLGISKSTLQNLRDSRKIRHTRASKGIILYDKNHIDEILENNIVEVV